MIKTRVEIIKGREFVRTYSDKGMRIERDGAMYDEAVDPVEFGRQYTETDEPIPDIELSAEEALDIITGGTL